MTAPVRLLGESSRAKDIAGGIGGTFACLVLIVGAVILRKTWRTLAVKKERRNRDEMIMLGGGAAFAARRGVCAVGVSTAIC